MSEIEEQIKALSPLHQEQMARLVLAGYRFVHQSSRDWWNVKNLKNQIMLAHGGLKLCHVVDRVWRTYNGEQWHEAADSALRKLGVIE